MKSEDQIRSLGVSLKIAMQKRAARIRQLANELTHHLSNPNPQKEGRIETIQNSIAKAQEAQKLEAQQLAVVRWIFGVTEGIDPENLGLDE